MITQVIKEGSMVTLHTSSDFFFVWEDRYQKPPLLLLCIWKEKLSGSLALSSWTPLLMDRGG